MITPKSAHRVGLSHYLDVLGQALAKYPANHEDTSAASANRFLDRLPDDKLPTRIGLSNDEEVSLFWDYEGVFVDVGFVGRALGSFYVKTPQGEWLGDPGLAPASDRETELIALIPSR